MGAAKLDITIEQGNDFQLVVTVVGGPVSLTGYVGQMQIRPSKQSTDLLYDVPPGSIVTDAANRQVVVTLPWTETDTFDWDSGAYDISIESADSLHRPRIAEGKVLIDHWVTRVAA